MGVPVMGPLVAVALWAAVGLGVLLVVQGFRGRQVVPSLRREAPGGVGRDAVLIWAMVALVTGVAVLAVTGWPVAAAAAVVLVVMIPRLMSGQRTHQEYIQRTQAIATWTEMIRDNMAGAAGLGQALQATTVFAPAPIAPEIRRFSARLDHSSLVDALHALGEDLNHPSADLIVVALSNAARLETRELAVARKDGQSSPLLSRLATAIRDDVRMRLRVDVGRARIRTSARIVVATTVLTIVFLYLFAGDLLEPYDTLAGQAWMCVVTAVFVLGGWMLSVYGRVQMPERFSTRRRSQRAVGEGRP